METQTKTIWIKGSNESFKDKILFKCICKVEGDKLILGEPFIKGSFPINKFKDNSEQNPFNYMIAISTYEKVLGKEDRFKEFYNYLGSKAGELKKSLGSEETHTNTTSDSIYISFRVNTGKIKEQISLDLLRESITKINLRIHTFNNRTQKEFSDKEFEDFKQYVNNYKQIILKDYEEKIKVNPYLEEVRDIIKLFIGEEKTNTYKIYAYSRDLGDRIYFDIEFESYKIPEKHDDTIKDYENAFNYKFKFENDSYTLCNGCFHPKEEVKNKTLEELKQFLCEELSQAKKNAQVTKEQAMKEKEILQEEYNKENTLTEERYKHIIENYKVGDKVTIEGVEGMFGNITFEGRLSKIEENCIGFIAKGSRTRGIWVYKGSQFKKIKRGYQK